MKRKIDPQLFTAHEQALPSSPCPQCGATLQLRHGKHGPFLGCSAYPECDYIQSLHHNDAQVLKPLGVACPACGHELVLRQGRYGMFIGCSDYPQCHHIESTDSPHQPSEPVLAITCPECAQGHLIERQSRFGKRFYACDRYPKCKFALNGTPRAQICTQCGFSVMLEKHSAAGMRFQCVNRKCGHIQAVATGVI